MKRTNLAIAVALSIPLSGVLAAAESRTEDRLYVLNSRTDDMTVVDVGTDKIIGAIKVGQQPHGISTRKGGDLLYVTAERAEKGLSFVDPIKGEVLESFAVGKGPQTLAATSDGRLLYIPLRAECFYVVFDTVGKKIVARIPIEGHPHNTAIAPDSRFAYLAPHEGGSALIGGSRRVASPGNDNSCGPNKKIYVVDTRTNKVVDTIPTLETPRPIAISPEGKYLYVQTDFLLGFLVVDLAKRRVTNRVEYELTPDEMAEPSRSHGIGVAANGREVWATNVNHDLVHVFDVTQNPPKQIAKLKTGRGPTWVTATPDGKKVYIANESDDTVSVFNVETKTETSRIQLPKGKAPKSILVVSVPKAQENVTKPR